MAGVDANRWQGPLCGLLGCLLQGETTTGDRRRDAVVYRSTAHRNFIKGSRTHDVRNLSYQRLPGAIDGPATIISQ